MMIMIMIMIMIIPDLDALDDLFEDLLLIESPLLMILPPEIEKFRDLEACKMEFRLFSI